MSHIASCETATSYTCKCPCGGARHGGVLIAGLRTTSEATREKAKQLTEPRRWEHASSAAKQSTVSNTVAERRPALTGVIMELVSTLIDQVKDEGEIDAVETLAKEISDDIADEFEKRLSNGGPNSKKSRHLWCVVIATICRVYDEVSDAAGESIDVLTDRTMQLLRAATSDSRTDTAEVTDIYRQRTSVARAFEIDEYDWMNALIKKALKAVVAAIKAIGEEATMKYVRLIRAIICPDPDRHPAVVKHCIWPLLNGPFREALEDALAAEMRAWIRNAYMVLPPTPIRTIPDRGAAM